MKRIFRIAVDTERGHIADFERYLIEHKLISGISRTPVTDNQSWVSNLEVIVTNRDKFTDWFRNKNFRENSDPYYMVIGEPVEIEKEGSSKKVRVRSDIEIKKKVFQKLKKKYESRKSE